RSGWADLDEAPTYSVTAARLAGIRDAGIEPAASWECRGSLVDEGIAAGRELLELTPTPTALIGFSDLIAAGMLLAAREAGLEVPAPSPSPASMASISPGSAGSSSRP